MAFGNNYCPRVVKPVAAGQLSALVGSAKPGETLFVKFASAFCGACQASRHSIDTALKQSKDCVNVVELDSDVADVVADSYGVKNLPTMVAVREGKVVGRMEGSGEPAAYLKFFAKFASLNGSGGK